MEQNKAYIIILVVALVAAILIVAGIFLFSPREDASADQSEDTFDPYVYLREPPEDPEQEVIGGILSGPNNLVQLDPGEPLIFHQQQIYGQQSPEQSTEQSTVQDAQTEVRQSADIEQSTILEPDISIKSDTGIMKSDIGIVRSDTGVETPKPKTVRTSARQKSAKPVQGRPGTTPSISRKEPQTRTITEYWIQLFASTSQQAVLDAGEELGLKGISGKISAQRRNNALYYRLRYGPFTVAEEAEKFLAWIQNLEEYANSYISQEYYSKRID